MSAPYLIRSAHPAESARLQDVERRAAVRFDDHGLGELFAAIVTPEAELKAGASDGRLWAAVDARDEPVGFALACQVGGNAHLDELDVLPEHGRRGIGAALVERVLSWAVERELKAVTLTTLQHIPWNAPFYSQMGFEVLAENALSDALRDLLRAEVARGLPADGRVAMLRNSR